MEVADAINQWNEAAARCGWPAVRMMTPARTRRIKEIIFADLWQEALAKAEASDFLCGRSKRGPEHEAWRLTLDTFIRPSFFARLIDGNYDNREPDTGPHFSKMSNEEVQWRARLAGFAHSGFWLQMWGPKPGAPGCQVPANLLTH